MNTGKIVELLQSILCLKKTFEGITAWIEEDAHPHNNNLQLFANQLSGHDNNPVIKKNISTRSELMEVYDNKETCIREEELIAQRYIYQAIAEKYRRTPIGETETFEYPEKDLDERAGTKYQLRVYQETGEYMISVKIKDYQLDDDNNMQTTNLEEFTI